MVSLLDANYNFNIFGHLHWMVNRMNEISKSPKRHTFQEEGYIKHCEEKGEEPNPDYVNLYKTWREQDEENLVDLGRSSNCSLISSIIKTLLPTDSK